MSDDWATEHLQVIRTLMERSAVYRRALGPVMLLTGIIGLLAAIFGWFFKIDSPRAFVGYWTSVSLLPLIGSFLMVRRQALKDAEPFWSLPTRRVTQALAPPLAVGFIASIITFFHVGTLEANIANVIGMLWLPIGWTILYGCALHSAGFFMRRGIKLFGWLFIAGGCSLFALGIPDVPRPLYAHGVMGFFFGALHLAYGTYLCFTEKAKNEA